MSSLLPIVERFHSLQGEGIHFGKSAFFIRLGGCTVGCPWCDTKESWPFNSHQKVNVLELARAAKVAQSQGAGFLIITGGEPLHHNLNALCKAIKDLTATDNYPALPIHLETSGVNEISGVIDWITLSPKRHSHPLKSLLRECDEIKVIVQQKEDLDFAEKIAKESINEKQNVSAASFTKRNKAVNPHLFLQPEWENEEGRKLTIEYLKTHPSWRLSLQTHKWLGVL